MIVAPYKELINTIRVVVNVCILLGLGEMNCILGMDGKQCQQEKREHEEKRMRSSLITKGRSLFHFFELLICTIDVNVRYRAVGWIGL